MNVLDKFFKGFGTTLSMVANGLLFLVVITASVDVFNRLVAGASLAWAQQSAVWLNLFVVFLLGPVMVMEDGHIRVRFVIDKLKGAVKKTTNYINDIAFFIFCSFALWGSLLYVFSLAERNATRVFGTMYFPYWPIAAFLPMGMGLFILAGVYRLLRTIFPKPPAITQETRED